MMNRDYVKSFLQQIRDERLTHANTATRVGNAMLMLLDYLSGDDSPFLRKDQDDATSYLLKLLGGAVIGESKNITLNPDGSITCGRIYVDGSAIFNELVINHQNVLEGDTFFTDRSIIDSIVQDSVEEWTLALRRSYDNEKVSFHVGDVLRSSINRLDGTGIIDYSWMRVTSVDQDKHAIKVAFYDDEDVPGGKNCLPIEHSVVVRWGNSVDTNRQNTFFVSSTEGRFVFLQGVTKPITDDNNCSAFIGLPPELDTFRDLPINKRQPYIYARGLIVQDLIQMDYQGNPVYTYRDLGTWSRSQQYISGYDNDAHGYYTDRVWWGGCLWQASVEKTTVGKEPRFTNTDWTCLIGGANMSIEIVSSAGDFFPAGRPWNTTLEVIIYNAEMRLSEEDLSSATITWTRSSDDESSDEAWNLQHKNVNSLQIMIDSVLDVNGEWTAKSKLGFKCMVAIPDKEQLSAAYTINM